VTGAGVDPAAFARLLAGYCLEVAPGQQIVLRSTTLAAPLLLELQRAVLERGAWPLLRVELPGQTRGHYASARDVHLDGFAPLALEEAERADASLGIQAPENTRALTGIDPERVARAARGRAPVRAAGLGRRWCLTVWPTEALAQEAGLALPDYAAFVRSALFLDRPDPVAAWGELRALQARLIDRLSTARQLRIEAAGTDLTLDVRGRTWVNSDGRRNMPSGEVFTGPVETSATGHVRFDVPSSPAGVAVAGVELTFARGEVTAARADTGDAYLQRALATDPGARRLGEVGIGTNFGITRPTGTILFDEKIKRAIRFAPPRGRSGSRTPSSAIVPCARWGRGSRDEPLCEARPHQGDRRG